MEDVFVYWGVSALVILGFAVWIGYLTKGMGLLGIFIDFRGRYSLTRFQISMWTILVLSLFSAVFIARWTGGVDTPLSIKIPSDLLILMGISIGSTVASEAVKADKDTRAAASQRGTEPKLVIAKTDKTGRSFRQLFMVEEGDYADKAIDITKFQNFCITLIVLAAYVAATIVYINAKTAISCLNELPGLNSSMLTLIGISHAGYVAGKLPDKKSEQQQLGMELKPKEGEK